MSRTKYNVDKDKKKRSYDGIVFDSILEMKFYRDVILPNMESGQIRNAERQVPYELQPKFVHDGKTVQPIKYIADFVLVYKDGTKEVIDVKGMPDSTAIIKRKMFWYAYPELKYNWMSYTKATGWITYDELKKIRRDKKKKNRR